MKPFSTLLVGFGKIAAHYATDPRVKQHFTYSTHAEVLRDHPDFDWQAVVDPDTLALETASKDWSVPFCVTALSELPAAFAPEVAVLATPPQQRLTILAQLPKSVRLILAEKPLGTSQAETVSFIQQAEARGITVAVNYWRRTDHHLESLKCELQQTPMMAGQLCYGNGLYNNGSHMLDLVQMLLGEIAELTLLDIHPTYATAWPEDLNLSFWIKMTSGLGLCAQALDFKHYRENSLELWGAEHKWSILQEGLILGRAPRQAHRALSDHYEVSLDQMTYHTSGAGRALYDMYSNLRDFLTGRMPLKSSAQQALVTARWLAHLRNQVT
jgi:predicted dehydrogenase